LQLNELYADAGAVTAQGSRSFYFATRFFPREMARSAHAVYWFCRHTDDLVDECESIEQGRTDLEEWSSKLNAGLAAGHSDHPVLTPFLDTVQRCAIPHEYPLELLEGMRMDLNATRYDTFDDLRVFCYRVASVVGLMMSHVIGYREPALPHAVDLGIAMQLTNILRDVGEDLDRGRIYLPAEDLERFDYTERDLRARISNTAFRELMKFEAARARAYYRSAEPGIQLLSRQGRFAVQIAGDVYKGILTRIERSNYNVFENRAVVPASQKYWLTAKALLK
jgi:phytoene synthase